MEWQYLVSFPKMQTNGDYLGVRVKQITLAKDLHIFEVV